MQQKPAATSVAIHELLARRWSPRAIDPAKPVARAQLVALLEASHGAPSCFNDQPWRYLVWDRFHDTAAWQRAFQCLTPVNQSWVKNAPVLLLATAGNAFAIDPARLHLNKDNGRWMFHNFFITRSCRVNSKKSLIFPLLRRHGGFAPAIVKENNRGSSSNGFMPPQ